MIVLNDNEFEELKDKTKDLIVVKNEKNGKFRVYHRVKLETKENRDGARDTVGLAVPHVAAGRVYRAPRPAAALPGGGGGVRVGHVRGLQSDQSGLSIVTISQ